jgi:hypothetical protein
MNQSTEAGDPEVPNSKALYIECEVEELITTFLVDTGSTISIINKETWEKISRLKAHIRLKKGIKRAITAHNQPLQTMGIAFLKVKTGEV